jgi:hypothetical protein
MPDEVKPQNNYDRLLKHLKEGSLAARLVQAHRTPAAGGSAETMKTVLRERLEQVREKIDNTKA